MPVFASARFVVNSSADGTATRWFPLNQYSQPFNVGFGVQVSGPEEWRVQHTFDDVQDSTVTPFAFTHSDASAFEARIDGNYAFPVAAIRLQMVSAAGTTSANATFQIRQSGL